MAEQGGVNRTFEGPFCTEGKGPAQLLLTGQSRCRNSHCDRGTWIQGATCASPSLLPVPFPGRLDGPLQPLPMRSGPAGRGTLPPHMGGRASRAGPSVLFLRHNTQAQAASADKRKALWPGHVAELGRDVCRGAGTGREGSTVHSEFGQAMQEVRGTAGSAALCPVRQGTGPDPRALCPHALFHAALLFGGGGGL